MSDPSYIVVVFFVVVVVADVFFVVSSDIFFLFLSCVRRIFFSLLSPFFTYDFVMCEVHSSQQLHHVWMCRHVLCVYFSAEK